MNPRYFLIKILLVGCFIFVSVISLLFVLFIFKCVEKPVKKKMNKKLNNSFVNLIKKHHNQNWKTKLKKNWINMPKLSQIISNYH